MQPHQRRLQQLCCDVRDGRRTVSRDATRTGTLHPSLLADTYTDLFVMMMMIIIIIIIITLNSCLRFSLCLRFIHCCLYRVLVRSVTVLKFWVYYVTSFCLSNIYQCNITPLSVTGRGRFTGSTPEMLTSKFSTLFRHISAVADVNIVTILSRRIAFSFHLKRSVTLIKCWKGVCGQGSARTQLGELMTFPQTRLGRGHPSPISTQPPCLRRLISVNLLRIFFWILPWSVWPGWGIWPGFNYNAWEKKKLPRKLGTLSRLPLHAPYWTYELDSSWTAYRRNRTGSGSHPYPKFYLWNCVPRRVSFTSLSLYLYKIDEA